MALCYVATVWWECHLNNRTGPIMCQVLQFLLFVCQLLKDAAPTVEQTFAVKLNWLLYMKEKNCVFTALVDLV